MTWTKISDSYFEQEAQIWLSRDARLLHIEATVWCNRALNDGVVPCRLLRKITDAEAPERLVEELEERGLWIRLAEPDRWQIDMTDQELAETVHKRREAAAVRQRKWRERQDRRSLGGVVPTNEGSSVSVAGEETRYLAGDQTRTETPCVTADVARGVTLPHPGPALPDPEGGKGPGTPSAKAGGTDAPGWTAGLAQVDVAAWMRTQPGATSDDPHPYFETPAGTCANCHRDPAHELHRPGTDGLPAHVAIPRGAADCGWCLHAADHPVHAA